MKRPNRKWIWLVVVVLAAVEGYFLLRPKPVPVEVAKVTRGPMMVTVEEEGETRIHDHFIISAPVAGRLLRIDLQAGDSVQVGQVVARILPAPIEPRQRAELTAQFNAAQAATREAQAQVDRAQSEYAQASRDRSRSEQLAASGVISREALEQSQTKETSGRKVLDAARERSGGSQGAGSRGESATARKRAWRRIGRGRVGKVAAQGQGAAPAPAERARGHAGHAAARSRLFAPAGGRHRCSFDRSGESRAGRSGAARRLGRREGDSRPRAPG